MSEIAMRMSAGGALRRLVWVLLAAVGAAAVCPDGFASAASLRVAQATPQGAEPQPAPAPAPAPGDSKADTSLGTPATVIDGQAAESLLGKKVQSAKGEDLGRIVDVIVDKAGQIRAAVIDFGGFLGVGSRKIAVDWRMIHMTADGKLDHLVVSLPLDQLRSSPAYKEGEPVVVIGPPAEAKIPAAPAQPAISPPPAPAADAPAK